MGFCFSSMGWFFTFTFSFLAHNQPVNLALGLRPFWSFFLFFLFLLRRSVITVDDGVWLYFRFLVFCLFTINFVFLLTGQHNDRIVCDRFCQIWTIEYTRLLRTPPLYNIYYPTYTLQHIHIPLFKDYSADHRFLLDCIILGESNDLHTL